MTGYIQSNTADTTLPTNPATVSLAFTTANVTAGSTLVAIGRLGVTIANSGAISISDNVNGAWTQAFSAVDDGSGNQLFGFSVPNSGGGSKPTVTIGTAALGGSLRWYIQEVGTPVTASTIDGANTVIVASSTAVTGATRATAAASTHLIAVFEGNNGASTVTHNVAGSNPASAWTNRAAVATSKLIVDTNDVTSTGTYGENLTLSPADNGYSGIIAVKISTALTLVATPLGGAAPTLGTPVLAIYSAVVLGNNVLDFGLNRLHTNANSIYICSTVPTTYVQATTTFSLGNASIAAGTLFGTMANGSPTGRIVNSAVVSAGAVTAAGTPVCWAVVDSVNSDLMATGPGSGFTAVTSGQTWQLASFDIHMSNT
jgi:hypothetical protein